jgi:hypothetical protein
MQDGREFGLVSPDTERVQLRFMIAGGTDSPNFALRLAFKSVDTSEGSARLCTCGTIPGPQLGVARAWPIGRVTAGTPAIAASTFSLAVSTMWDGHRGFPYLVHSAADPY